VTICQTHSILQQQTFFCSDDEHWNLLDEEQKQKISFTSRADGEFYMSYRDFCRQFQEITICTLGPDFDGDGIGDMPGKQ